MVWFLFCGAALRFINTYQCSSITSDDTTLDQLKTVIWALYQDIWANKVKICKEGHQPSGLINLEFWLGHAKTISIWSPTTSNITWLDQNLSLAINITIVTKHQTDKKT